MLMHLVLGSVINKVAGKVMNTAIHALPDSVTPDALSELSDFEAAIILLKGVEFIASPVETALALTTFELSNRVIDRAISTESTKSKLKGLAYVITCQSAPLLASTSQTLLRGSELDCPNIKTFPNYFQTVNGLLPNPKTPVRDWQFGLCAHNQFHQPEIGRAHV